MTRLQAVLGGVSACRGFLLKYHTNFFCYFSSIWNILKFIFVNFMDEDISVLTWLLDKLESFPSVDHSE